MTLRFESLPLPKFRYSPAVRMGPFVKTAGMIGLNPQTDALIDGGAGAEFRQILTNLEGLMADNNLSLPTLMSATLFVTAFHRFPDVNAVWDAFFANSQNLPARTAVGATQLPLGAQIEAEFMFYAPSADAGETI